MRYLLPHESSKIALANFLEHNLIYEREVQMSDLHQFFGNGFDANSIEPQGDFEVLPPGKYPVLIEKAEVKKTKTGDGHYVALVHTILDGPGKNRKLFNNINIDNPSQQCMEIGLRTLAALGQALGLTCISDTSQLVNKTCIAHVKVKDDRNEIRTYSALTQNPNPAPYPNNSTYPIGQPNFETKTNEPNPQANQTRLAEAENCKSQPASPPPASRPPWMR